MSDKLEAEEDQDEGAAQSSDGKRCILINYLCGFFAIFSTKSETRLLCYE